MVENEVLRIARHGRNFWINDPGGRVGSKLANGEPYERKLLDDIYRRGLAGRVAFDVGAHVGNHTLFLAAICEMQVYAFEAHPETYERLVANIDLNPGIANTVQAIEVAVGAGDGTARFVEAMTLEPGGQVAVRALDDIVPPVDVAVVKVDVEGMEPQALLGMRNHLERCKPAIYAETHTRAAHTAIADVLTPLGYTDVREIQMGSLMVVWEAR